jgi:hypothetical protein
MLIFAASLGVSSAEFQGQVYGVASQSHAFSRLFKILIHFPYVNAWYFPSILQQSNPITREVTNGIQTNALPICYHYCLWWMFVCYNGRGEPQVKQLTRSTFFFSSNAQDMTEWTDKRADRQTVSCHALGRGNKGELNGSRGWGRLHMMSQLTEKIPHGHVTSNVLLSQINNGDIDDTFRFGTMKYR